MTDMELLLQKLDAIERKLNQIFVPIQNEQQRQLDMLPAEERKKAAKVLREEHRARLAAGKR